MVKKNWQSIALVGLVGISLFLWILGRRLAGVSGFPLDDAWIHQTYARSLASGGGWSFTPGVPSAGATAPLWVLLLVPGYWLDAAPFTWILILAGFQLWLVGVLALILWRQMDLGKGWWGLAAAALLAFEWHLVWAALSGMETLLYGVLSLAVVTILFRLSSQSEDNYHGWLGLGLLVGVGVWLRPEAVTLLGPVGMVAVLMNAGKPATRFKNILAAFLGFTAIFVTYLIFNHWLAGSWWPNTFYAKQAEYAVMQGLPFLSRLVWQFSPLLAGGLAVLLPGFILNMYYSIKKHDWAALAGGIWALGHITMYAWRLPVTYQHGRYVIPVVPLLVLLGFAGYYQVVSEIHSSRFAWLLSRAWGGAVFCFVSLFWLLGMQSYLDDVAMIDGEMVRTAAWIEENTGPDELIAAHDIGALGYFTQRPILDLAGLVSPDVIPFIRDEAQLAQYLDEACPRYLVTFPHWYFQLPEMGDLLFQTDTLITRDLGGTNMAVYRWIGSGSCP
jgi:hypothetical protein